MDIDNMPFKIIDNQGIEVPTQSMAQADPIVSPPANLQPAVQPPVEIIDSLAVVPAVPLHNLNARPVIRGHQFAENMVVDDHIDVTFATVGAGIFIVVLILGIGRWFFVRRYNVWNGLRVMFGAPNERTDLVQEQVILPPAPVNDEERPQKVPQNRSRERDNQTFITIPQGAITKQKR